MLTTEGGKAFPFIQSHHFWQCCPDFPAFIETSGERNVCMPFQFSHSVVPNSLHPHKTAVRQASLSITRVYSNSCTLSEWCHPTTLCHPLLHLPSIFPSIRVFSNEPVLCIKSPKYWSFSFNISPSNEYSGLISFRMDWLDLMQSKGPSRVFSSTTVQKHQFFGVQLSL